MLTMRTAVLNTSGHGRQVYKTGLASASMRLTYIGRSCYQSAWVCEVRLHNLFSKLSNLHKQALQLQHLLHVAIVLT